MARALVSAASVREDGTAAVDAVGRPTRVGSRALARAWTSARASSAVNGSARLGFTRGTEREGVAPDRKRVRGVELGCVGSVSSDAPITLCTGA